MFTLSSTWPHQSLYSSISPKQHAATWYTVPPRMDTTSDATHQVHRTDAGHRIRCNALEVWGGESSQEEHAKMKCTAKIIIIIRNHRWHLTARWSLTTSTIL